MIRTFAEELYALVGITLFCGSIFIVGVLIR